MRLQEKKGRDYYAVTGILCYAAALFFRVFLVHMIGEKGVGYFSMANELYVLLCCVFSYGLTEAVSLLVRYRMKREMVKSADRVWKAALVFALVVGGILSAVLLLGAHGFMEKLFQLPLSGLALSMMAPALVFHMLTGVVKGYFQGNGSRVPGIHSRILETVFLLAGGLVGTKILYGYGQKVAALLQNGNYAAAYGARGAAIGIVSSSVFCFCHMLLLCLLYRGRTKRQDNRREQQRNQDRGFRILYTVVATALPYSAYMLLQNLLPLVDGSLFFRFQKGDNSLLLWGNYYGKYMTVIGIVCAAMLLPYSGQIKSLTVFMDRNDYEMARERLGVLLHQTALYTVAAAVFTAVLSENLLNLLFRGNNTETAGWVMWGSILIVFGVFAVLFMTILFRLRRIKTAVGILAGAFVLHVAAAVLLLKMQGMGITSLIAAGILFYGAVMTGGFLTLAKLCRYRQEWLKAVAFTVVAAGIAGLIMMGINKLLSPFTGSTISLVICLPVGVLLYLVFLLLSRAVTREELQNMTGGVLLLKIGEWTHFMQV